MNSMIALERLQAEGRLPASSDSGGGEFAQVVRALVAESPENPAPQAPRRSRGANTPPAPPTTTPPAETPEQPPETTYRTGGLDNVPETAKYPLGPYRQAPAEYGGKWWLVNPFTAAEPWLHADGLVQEPQTDGPAAPEDFVAVFGERPVWDKQVSYQQFKDDLAQWDHDLTYFQQSGVPEGFSEEKIQLAGDVFEAWGLGRPVFYEGRYGWTATFPSAEVEHYQAAVFTAIEAPHLVIAKYQLRQIREGVAPAQQHPFVPGRFFPQSAA